MPDMLRRISADKPFRILSFTDMHLSGHANRDDWTECLLCETVQEEKPDLIVFVGDNVTGGDNLARARAFADCMTGLGVPWCPILGNHEGDNPASIGRRQMMDIFAASPTCCIPPDAAKYGDGRMDYAVSLKNAEGNVVCKLLFMDCGKDMTYEELRPYGLETPVDKAYACLSHAQIDWYREQVHGCACPSIVFCHVPLPEYRLAAEENAVISGGNREKICCSPCNSGMFDAMLRAGSTVAFVAGHDHINDSHMLYRGVRLVYNRMSGYDSYNVLSEHKGDKLLQGCSVYTIHVDGAIEYGDIVYEDRYPQYRAQILQVIRK